MFLSDPVRNDQLEISVFGRGFGETILVHLPGGEWLIVDSCLDPETHDPVPLRYLQSMGVDTARLVKWIVASHWHSDHIRGLARTVSECNSADFWCSAALEERDLRDLVYAYGRQSGNFGGRNGSEFIDVMQALRARPKPSRSSINPVNPARADTRIHLGHFEFDSQDVPMEIWALSPSSVALVRSLAELPALWERYRRRLECDYRPTNDVCVVLLVQVGTMSVLLGSDLQEVTDPQDGWTAIINSTGRPQTRSSSFKVAHHGSSNSYHSQIWEDMLVENPIAALTPFQRGSINLPERDQIEVIYGHTEHAYIAGGIRRQRVRKADSMVQRRQGLRAKKLTWLKSKLGHIRIRTSVANPEDIQTATHGEATPLRNWKP